VDTEVPEHVRQWIEFSPDRGLDLARLNVRNPAIWASASGTRCAESHEACAKQRLRVWKTTR